MKAVLAIGLLALTPISGCVTSEPAKPQVSALLLESATCSASACRLASVSGSDIELHKAAKLAEAVADLGVVIMGSDPAQPDLARALGEAAVDKMVEGKSSQGASDALLAKVQECMAPVLERDQAAKEPRNG
jgi:hypothetical protein